MDMRLLKSGSGDKLVLSSLLVKLLIMLEISLLLLSDEFGLKMSEWNWSSLKK